jgi:NAD+ kinase
VAVVLKRSAWTKWVEEERDPKILSLVSAGDETVHRMRPGHMDHVETIEEVRMALDELRVEATWHEHPHDFRLPARARYGLVITVGGDGTLLGASHGIGPDVPLLGVNSAPNHSVGFFCAAKKGTAGRAIAAALDGSLDHIELTRMAVDRNGKRLHHRVLNEALFCHVSPAATSRYILRVVPVKGSGTTERYGRAIAEEDQKSSGLWIGPAAGSTAAQHSAGGRVLPIASREVQFVVREPYRPWGTTSAGAGRRRPPDEGRGPPGTRFIRLTRGLIDDSQALAVKSKMRSARLFLDGDHIAHDVSIGDVLTFRRSEEPLTVLGLGAAVAQGRRATAKSR